MESAKALYPIGQSRQISPKASSEQNTCNENQNIISELITYTGSLHTHVISLT